MYVLPECTGCMCLMLVAQSAQDVYASYVRQVYVR
jgi:hypothetical protein